MVAALPAIRKSIRVLVCGEWHVQLGQFLCFLQCEFIGHLIIYKSIPKLSFYVSL